MPKLSASELIEILVDKYHFIHNDLEELEDIDQDLFEDLSDYALVFNYGGDYIIECGEPEEGEPSVETIYKFIRKSGWSLEVGENPLDMCCWILYPTERINYPMTTLLDM